MAADPLHLDEATLARAQRLADELKIPVDQVVASAIERLAAAQPAEPPPSDLLGAFADCAELLDEIVEEAYRNREQLPLRQPGR